MRWGLREAFAGLVLSLVVPSLVGAAALAVLDQDIDDLTLTGQVLLQLPLWALLVGVCGWVSVVRGRRSLADDFGLRMVPWDVPVGLAVGVGTQLVAAQVVAALYRWVGIDADQIGRSAEELADRAGGTAGAVVALVLFAGLAPFAEELFYRGLWLRALRQHLGRWAAIGVDAVLFASVHFAPYDFPALVVVGAVFAWLAVRTGRLGPSIWAHVGFNATALTFLLWSG